MLIKERQTQKTIECVVSFTWNSRKGLTRVIESRYVVARCWGRAGRGVDCRGKKEPLCFLTVVTATQLYKFDKTNWIVYLKLKSFIVYKVQLNKSDFKKKTATQLN